MGKVVSELGTGADCTQNQTSGAAHLDAHGEQHGHGGEECGGRAACHSGHDRTYHEGHTGDDGRGNIDQAHQIDQTVHQVDCRQNLGQYAGSDENGEQHGEGWIGKALHDCLCVTVLVLIHNQAQGYGKKTGSPEILQRTHPNHAEDDDRDDHSGQGKNSAQFPSIGFCVLFSCSILHLLSCSFGNTRLLNI